MPPAPRARGPVDLTIEGQGLAALQRKIKAMQDVDRRKLLTKELNKGLRTGARHLPEEARQAALADLPHTGGLAETVASGKYGLRVLSSARAAGIAVVVRSGGKLRDIRATNAGRLRHPVFARSDQTRKEWAWVNQAIPAGWFTNRMRREAPKVRPDLVRAMEAVAQKIAKS